uniref:Uncharacterized protein n=1 Tax=Physcomitrium patens TaxID=3218 RepID=A9TAJ9_PHYPA|nr:hypothetical protein PHYPA_020665 [Physcomitrium patens]
MLQEPFSSVNTIQQYKAIKEETTTTAISITSLFGSFQELDLTSKAGSRRYSPGIVKKTTRNYANPLKVSNPTRHTARKSVDACAEGKTASCRPNQLLHWTANEHTFNSMCRRNHQDTTKVFGAEYSTHKKMSTVKEEQDFIQVTGI